MRGAAPFHNARARIMHRAHRQQLLVRLDRMGPTMGAHARRLDLHFARGLLQGVHRVQAPAGGEDDRGAVGGGLAQVALLGAEVRVHLQVSAVLGHRPEVPARAISEGGAQPRGVRGEDEAVPEPGRAGLISQKVVEQRLPGAFRVALSGRIQRHILAGDPQLRSGSALVVLPVGGRVAPRGDHHGGSVLMQDHLGGATQRQHLNGALQGDRAQHGVLLQGRPLGAADQHATIGKPAGDAGIAATPGGQTTRLRGAVHRQHPHFGAAAGAGHIGHMASVGRKTREGDGGAVIGEAPGPAAGQRRHPDVIRGGEDHLLPVHIGMAKVRGVSRHRHGHHPMRLLWWRAHVLSRRVRNGGAGPGAG